MVNRAEAERLLYAFQAAAIAAYTQHDGPSELDTKREEARAAVLAAMTPQWRDTETDPPPKDQPVLLYCPDRGTPTNRARIELGPYWTSRGSLHAWATHWQLLPDAPEAP